MSSVLCSITRIGNLSNQKVYDNKYLEIVDKNVICEFMRKVLKLVKTFLWIGFLLFLIIGPGIFGGSINSNTLDSNSNTDSTANAQVDPNSTMFVQNGKQITITRISSTSSKTGITTTTTPSSNSDLNQPLQTLSQVFPTDGCTNSGTNILVVLGGSQNRDYLNNNGFAGKFDTFTSGDFASITAATVRNYRMIIIEPNQNNMNQIATGLSVVASVMQTTSCLTVGIRAGTPKANTNVDFLGTDITKTINDTVSILNSTHPLITGIGYGGNQLYSSDFIGWSPTSAGSFTSIPTSQNGYHAILNNGEGITLFEYNYGRGHVLVDSLTSLSGDYGVGNPFFATNYVKYLNYSSYVLQSPILLEYPSNPTIKEYTSGNTLSWRFKDLDPGTYTVLKDNVPVQSGSWTSNQTLFQSFDNLASGTYNYTMVAYDQGGHSTQSTVIVTVVEGVPPNFVQIPNDLTYDFGYTGNTMSWTAIDNIQAGTYQVWVNDVVGPTGSWTNNTAININVDGLAAGTYNYTMQVFDAANNYAVDMANVTVIPDTSAPIINNPMDNTTFSIPLYTTGETLSWNITDIQPNIYVLYVDSVINSSGIFTSGVPIIANIDTSTLGTYNYTIFANDTGGYHSEQSVSVKIYDAVFPVFQYQPNAVLSYEYGSSDNKLSWAAFDEFPTSVDILRNGSLLFETGWINNVNISISTDGLAIGYHNYTAVFYDINNNPAVSTTILDVVDTTPPGVSAPLDATYQQRSSGNKISWTGTDLNPGFYSVYINGSLYQDGTWISNTAVQIPINTSSLGFFDYSIQFNDTSGNIASDTVIIHIIDTIAPTVSGPSSYPIYVEGSMSNFIDWVATDLNPNYYDIFRQETLVATGGWLSGSTIHYNIDGLSKGTYNFTLVAYDESGLNSKYQVNVTVEDQTNPIFSSTPSDFLYSLSTTGNTITWIATDSHPDTYVVYRDSSQIKSGSWVSSGSIIVNIDGLSAGTYNFTIEIQDQSGNRATDQVNVTVSGSPVIEASTSSYSYTNDTTGNMLSWTIYDANPDMYIIYNETVPIQSGSWSNGISVNINIDGLAIGSYNFTIFANDTDGLTDTNQINVYVSDIPVLGTSPGDIIYNEGDASSYSLIWGATDSLPDVFNITRNGVSVLTGSWNNTGTVKIYVNGLSKGKYTYTITFYDQSGNTISDTALVSVNDNTPPQFDSTPNDATYSESTGGNTVVWSVTDNYPDYYYIQQNGVNITGELSWNSVADISYNIPSSLVYGTYTYVIYVYDQSGNMVSDSVTITIEDQTAPIIDHPTDVTYNEQSSSSITWNPNDLHPMNYSIYINGSLETSGVWYNSTSIVFPLNSSLAAGFYVVDIYVNDTSNNISMDTVNVTVVDDIAPVITHPADILNYSQDTSSNVILWTGTDLHPSTYTVEKNGSLWSTYNSISWSSGVQFSVNIDTLGLGYYNFTIYMYDQSGNLVTDSVIVYVTDQTSPSISGPSDFNVEYGSSSNTITWIVSDTNPMNYSISNNTQLFESGNWDGSNIVINIDNMDLGTYTFVLTLEDIAGNQSTDTVIVNVEDTTIPLISHPSDVNYEQGTTSHSITWTITDLLPDTCNVTVDGSLYSNTWTSGQGVTINVDGLTYGTYLITFYANDTSGNGISDTVNVTVTDTTAPLVSGSPDFTFRESSGMYYINWTLTDLNPANYTIYKDSNPEEMAVSWSTGNTIMYDVSALTYGVYNFTILVYDTLSNFAVDYIKVTVTDAQPPVFEVAPTDFSFYQGSSGNYITWNASDSNAAKYNVTIDSVIFSENVAWTNYELVSVSVDSLPYGVHTVLIEVFDQTGNILRSTITVTVLDNIDPVVNSLSNTSIELGTSTVLQWNATDSNPDTYNITRNGILFDSGTWATSTYTTFNLGTLPIGTNNLVITFYDLAGNSVQDVLTVTVTDTTPPSVNSPSDLSPVEDGNESSYTIAWIGTDYNASTYDIWIDGVLNSSNNPWVSGISIAYKIPDITLGMHNFTVVFYDGFGLWSNDTVWVEIVDTMSPNVSVTPVAEHEQGSGAEYIIWIATDSNPSTYQLYVDDSPYGSSQSWSNGSSIQFNVNALSYGSHNVSIVFYDQQGNYLLDKEYVMIKDTTAPTIIAEPNREYVEGASDSITWSVSDANPSNFIIYRNTTNVLASGPWSGEPTLSISLNGLQRGVYNFTIVVEDNYGYKSSDQVLVSVVEYNPPVIDTTPSNLELPESVGSYTFQWSATDKYPATYSAYLNSILVNGYNNVTWSNSTALSVTIPSQTLGSYSLRIRVYDVFGNYVDSTINFSVADLTAPQVQRAPSANNTQIDFIAGDNSLLSWVFTDLHPNKYSVYNNGTALYNNLSWTSPLELLIPASLFAVGYTNFTIVVSDQYGNSIKYYNIIAISDDIGPTFKVQPTNMTMNEDTTGNSLTWEFADASGQGTYQVFKNNTSYFNGSWILNIQYHISLDSLETGTYNFTITVYDYWNNPSYDWVIVKVVDNNLPVYHEPTLSLDPTQIEGTTIVATWNFTEHHPNYYEIRVNGNIYKNSTWDGNLIELDMSNFSAGIYLLNVTVWDDSLNHQSNAFSLEILDEQIPSILSPPSNYEFYRNGSDPSLNWTAYDLHPATYTILVNGKFQESKIWYNGVPIIFATGILDFGIFNITIILYDGSGNSVSDSVIVRIKDPTITETQSPIIPDNLYRFEGDNDILNGTWRTLLDNSSIVNGRIQVDLVDSGLVTNSSVYFTNEIGYYEFLLNYTNIPIGNYYWNITFSKFGYETWTYQVDFSIFAHDYLINLQSASKLTRGEAYYITATVIYDDKLNTSLGLNEYYPITGEKAVGVIVTFSIEITNLDGLTKTSSQKSTTSSNGIATMILDQGETANIKSVISISAEIEKSAFGSGKTKQLLPNELPIVVSPQTDVGGFIGTFIAENFALLLFILLFFVFSFILVTIVRRRFTSRLKTTLKEMGDAKSELDDIEAIRAIIIQSDSGVPLYERRINQFGVDTTLVSGLLTAVSAFLGEVSNDNQEGFESLEREGLSITTHKAQNSNIIFIATKKFTLGTLDKIKNSHMLMENKFKNQLQSFIAGEFLDDLQVEEIFEKAGINLKLFTPLKLNKRNLRRISKMRSINRSVRDNIKLVEQPYYGRPGVSLSLDEITQELEKISHLTHEMIARVILLTFRNNALIPQETNGSEL